MYRFASAFADLASVLTAIVAVLIARKSIQLSARALDTQSTHNKLSVRPIPQILFADYENLLRVKVRNEGSGPLIVRAIQVTDGKATKEDVISWMEPLPDQITWSNFSSVFAGRAVLAGNELILLELDNRDGTYDSAEFGRVVEGCRNVLAKLTASVEFTDVYNGNFSPHVRDLSWFARDKGTRRKAKAVMVS